MKDNVLALKVVLPNGELMTTASRAKKSSAGYDLTRLMVGSEGTLGVITELTLKLSGIPEAISGGVCPFPSVEAACNAAIATIQSGIPVARIELLDELQVKAAVRSTGPPRRRTARACGRRAMTPIGPDAGCDQARRRSPPTSACRSRGWRNA
jgi:FAD/FMN-containing dehydrogenase